MQRPRALEPAEALFEVLGQRRGRDAGHVHSSQARIDWIDLGVVHRAAVDNALVDQRRGRSQERVTPIRPLLRRARQ